MYLCGKDRRYANRKYLNTAKECAGWRAKKNIIQLHTISRTMVTTSIKAAACS